MNFNRFEVAARLRGLLGGQDSGVIGSTANRLGVEEVALRMSVDDLDPHPTFEVLMAIVRDYGVDPTWLVSGLYDAGKHRQALADDAAIARVLSEAVILPIASSRPKPMPAAPRARPATSTEDEMKDGKGPQVKVSPLLDRRTREIEGDGLRWKVREEPWPTADRRGSSCLIFEADTVIRRVRNFTPGWYDMPDAELYTLSLGR